MGAWSHLPFGNDVACDWGHECERAQGFGACEAAFDRLLKDGSDESHGEEAIAAAEALCKAMGRGGQKDGFTSDVDLWAWRMAAPPSEDLVAKAEAALDRVLSPSDPLCTAWNDSLHGPEWRASVLDVRKRLRR